ncbi:MAG: hypothetical protein DI552_00050 [Brevundimonas sp.]|nr:MAG: hypothetical protein DI552_00050 [Brevundimonas sp.]
MRLVAELDARCGPPAPPPHPDLPATPAPGSNVAYVSKQENDRLVGFALAFGLGQFDKLSFDDTHRLAARIGRR